MPGQEGPPVHTRDGQMQELSGPTSLPGKRVPGEEGGPTERQGIEVALSPTQTGLRKPAVPRYAVNCLGDRERGGGSRGGAQARANHCGGVGEA